MSHRVRGLPVKQGVQVREARWKGRPEPSSESESLCWPHSPHCFSPILQSETVLLLKKWGELFGGKQEQLTEKSEIIFLKNRKLRVGGEEEDKKSEH